MAMNQPFTTASPINAVIDFQDIESGLGYVTFYGMTAFPSAGIQYLLSDQEEYSAQAGTTRNAAGTSTLTFDSSEFIFPRTVKGTALFSCGIGTNNSLTIGVKAQLYKYDGSTATSISSEITSQDHALNSEATMVLLQLPTTETYIAAGENIRLVVKLTTNNAQDGTIGHDPKGRDYGGVDTTNATTIMKLNVPFKIE